MWIAKNRELHTFTDWNEIMRKAKIHFSDNVEAHVWSDILGSMRAKGADQDTLKRSVYHQLVHDLGFLPMPDWTK